MRASLRRAAYVSVLAAAALGVGCSGSTESDGDGTSTPGTATGTTTAGDISPVLVNSALGVGPNRVALAFFNSDRGVIDDVSVQAAFQPVDAASDSELIGVELMPIRIEDHSGGQHAAGDALLTVYGATVEFPAAGGWRVALELSRDGTVVQQLAATFNVLDDLPHPSVGEAIPPTEQTVLADVEELAAIDTSETPDDALHELTVADALELGRPLVIGFATPAFCETRMCGPVVESVLRPLSERYEGDLEVLHIEPFDIARARSGELVTVPAMTEWGLSTEPWVFVTDAEGRVVAKFEGPVTFEEVESVLRGIGVGEG